MNCFTIDVDWAPEEVIEDTLDLFKMYNVPCTIFTTHKSEILDNCDRDLFEIGLHPNFNQILQGKGGNVEGVMSELKEMYPEAKGARSHSLTQSGYILEMYRKAGITYEANHFLPYHQGIKPFVLWNGMCRIPFNWEDDYHFALEYPFNDTKIDLKDKGLNIFNFHPIHIYLNSENNDRFTKIKHDQKNMDLLSSVQNNGEILGTRDILIALLKYVSKNSLTSSKLYDLSLQFVGKE